MNVEVSTIHVAEDADNGSVSERLSLERKITNVVMTLYGRLHRGLARI